MTNALVFTDFILVPQIDLSVVRAATLCIAVALLLYGLVWDVD